MIVIYHDIGGTHSSCVAANIHINRLSPDVIPDSDVLLSLPTFDKIQRKDWGHLMYVGTDEFGAKVYTICRQHKAKLVMPAVIDMYSVLNNGAKGLYLVDTIPAVNVWMAIGGYSSRVLNLVGFGRPIVTYGTIKAYNKIANLVKQLKERMKKEIEDI